MLFVLESVLKKNSLVTQNRMVTVKCEILSWKQEGFLLDGRLVFTFWRRTFFFKF